MKLTQRDVLALPFADDVVYWDASLPGFGVRLRGANKSWIVQGRTNGKQWKESLGDVRKVHIDEARKIARQFFAKSELGIDPKADKRSSAALTLGKTAERYQIAKAWLSKRTRDQAALIFSRDWAPLHSRDLSKVVRADVAARLQEIKAERGKFAAGMARAYLSAMYRWAQGEGLVENNPVAGTNSPIAGTQPRERVLDDAESKAVYDAAGDDDFGKIVRILQFTGLRRDEVGGLRWSEINLDTGVLTIPGERTKNGRTLTLELPEPVLNILDSVPQRPGHVFGDPEKGVTSWSHPKEHLDERIAAALGTPMPAWRLHDLRRTFRTGLGRLGVPPHIAELALNHVRKGMIAVYDRHTYQPEIADALNRWAEHLTAVIEGRKGKVVALRKRRT
jgi:integrase